MINPVTAAKKFVFKWAVTKGVKDAAKAVATFLVANQIATSPSEQAIAALIIGILGTVRNTLKHKFPEKFGWL